MNLAETLNGNALKLLSDAAEECDSLDVRAELINGVTVVDFAVKRTGSKQAGVLLSQICLGGATDVKLLVGSSDLGLDEVIVEIDSPLESCIGGQYAGWPLACDNYFAMCSGPIRMLRGKEAILEEYDLVGPSVSAVGVLEANQLPTIEALDVVIKETGALPEHIGLCVARTASYPGSIQVVARSVETTLHKLHELGFDLKSIKRGKGRAPLPPIPDDDTKALGWTNDSILYGATVELTVESSDEDIENILSKLPSSSSTDFGTPFLEIFKQYDHDFYKIDKMLFSPAHVVILNATTGARFEAGEIRNDILKKSFEL